MDFNAWAKEIHKNAVAHGWWETERPLEELLALIHSEWSEALEAYRDDEALLWGTVGKPEGIAVELIDGCIRIMDFAAHEGIELTEHCIEDNTEYTLPKFVYGLHYCVSALGDIISKNGEWFCKEEAAGWLSRAVNEVFNWIAHRGLDPMEIMKKKHAYNKTRPYRHGGKKA